MIERLGILIYWLGTGIGAIFCVLAVYFVASGANGRSDWSIGFGIIIAFAILSWGIGRAARYVLAGK